MPTPVRAINGSKLVIKFGDGATPEVFTEKCMINTSRGIEFQADNLEFLIPFCDSDAPGWKDREIDGLSAQFTGAGRANVSDIPFFDAWFRSGESKNAQVWVIADAGFGGYWQGAWKLNPFRLNAGNKKEKVDFECTILSDGEIAAYVVV